MRSLDKQSDVLAR